MMRKPSLILACLTFLGGALAPLYGSATGDVKDITGVTIDGLSALEAFNRGGLTIAESPYIYAHSEHTTPSSKAPQRALVGLRSIFIPDDDRLLLSSNPQGNNLDLTAECGFDKTPWSDTTPPELCYDQLVERALTMGPELFGTEPVITNFHKRIDCASSTLRLSHTIYASQGPIDLASRALSFQKTLVRTPTGLYLAPHPDLPAPFITGITLCPKIFYYTQDDKIHQSRTMCLEGTVDFQRGVFNLVCCDVERIEVTFSKQLLSIIQRDALVSHGLTPTPSLTSAQMGEALYALALALRDGKDGRAQDTEKAKALFTQYITMFARPEGEPFPELYGKAHHNLGTLAYKAGDFPKAAQHYEVAAGEGFDASKRNLMSMRIHEQIPSTHKERFLAICDYHGYTLPMAREDFRFDHYAPNANGDNSGEMGAGLGLCYKTFNNTAPGVLRAPVIWIIQPNGLTGDGLFETHLLVVGQTRIHLTS